MKRSVLTPINVPQIASTMDQFEKQFEDMDVRSAYMEDAINTSTSMTTPPEQVDDLIQVGFMIGKACEDMRRR